MLYWLHVCICLRLLVWNAGRSHVKKNTICKKVGGQAPPPAPPRPPPMLVWLVQALTVMETDKAGTMMAVDNAARVKFLALLH